MTRHTRRTHVAVIGLLPGCRREHGERPEQTLAGERAGARHNGLQSAGVHFHVRLK